MSPEEEVIKSIERGFRQNILPAWREWDKQVILGPRPPKVYRRVE